LWEVPTQQLKDLGLKGLLPLLPLTHEGKRQEVVEEMIVALCEGEREERSELLSLAYALSSLLFRSQDEQQWLKWRFGMLDDLLEESWALQEILQRGMKQGIEQGVKQGIEQGVKQGVEQASEQALVLSRHTVLALVEHHAPSLLPMARAKIERITDLAALQDLILQVSIASCESEVHTHLE
jgi:flagellar biosynthesis/type III secretory pathway protein FliH